MLVNFISYGLRGLRRRLRHPQGYGKVLQVGLPLIVGMASSTVMQITDRVFLANYSLEAMAAAMPAGILAFVPTAFFLGIGTYINVFIAHYYGAGARARIGPALWQGIYFSLLSAVLLALLSLSAELVFAYSGHPPEVRRLEETYFITLTLGGGLNVLMSVLGCFYSGQGLTKPIMLINFAGMLVNVPLDFILINGMGFIPEMGILGSGLATVISWFLECVLFVAVIFNLPNSKQYQLRPAPLEPDLLRRLLRFGLPSGVQFMMDMLAFTLFVLLVGRLGVVELATNNIVFSVNQIAFLPVVGLHVAINTLVGQALGAKDVKAAVFITNSALHLAMFYMGLAALCFVLFPMPFLEWFRPPAISAAEFSRITQTGVEMLRLVAFYCLFDSVSIVYSGALRGAGDTKFVMSCMLICSMVLMVAPTALAVLALDWGIMFCWYCLTLYVCVLGFIFWFRFRGDAWRNIEVVESGRAANGPAAARAEF